MSSPLHILILSGPTREYLDPVRYISNASSGRQGVELASIALERGHLVDVVQGPVEFEPPAGARVFAVTSAREMLECALERHASCDVLICVAAVSDFTPVRVASKKRKRHAGVWTLELVPTEDILSRLGERKERRVHVGFALETENLRENGLRKLLSKKLDWLVANPPQAVGSENGDYLLLGADGSSASLGRLSKTELAVRLLDVIEKTVVRT